MERVNESLMNKEKKKLMRLALNLKDIDIYKLEEELNRLLDACHRKE